MTEPLDRAALLEAVIDISKRAGAAILEIYAQDFEAVEKADGSPVTLADDKAEAVILPALRALTPDIPAISEEESSKGMAPEVRGNRFWLIDPLDGTKEFIKRNGEFTVNVALIEDRVPTLGVVYVPAQDVTYAGAGLGSATLQQGDAPPAPIAVREPDADGLIVVGSRSHADPEAMQAFLGERKIKEMRPAGSSLKLCLVARGEADIYPRLGPTMEWDTAAGHAVLLAAGGQVTTTDGGPFPYAKPDYRNPFFVASSGKV